MTTVSFATIVCIRILIETNFVVFYSIDTRESQFISFIIKFKSF